MNNYVTVKNAIPIDLCDEIIELGMSKNHQNGKIGDGTKLHVRKCHIGWIQPEELPAKNIIDEEVETANAELNWCFDLKEHPYEEAQFAIYKKGYCYDWHKDSNGEIVKDRVISVSVLLSDKKEFDGGDFQFEDGTVKELSGKGDMLIFPSTLTHRITPVKSGERYSLVIWFEK